MDIEQVYLSFSFAKGAKFWNVAKNNLIIILKACKIRKFAKSVDKTKRVFS